MLRRQCQTIEETCCCWIQRLTLFISSWTTLDCRLDRAGEITECFSQCLKKKLSVNGSSSTAAAFCPVRNSSYHPPFHSVRISGRLNNYESNCYECGSILRRRTRTIRTLDWFDQAA